MVAIRRDEDLDNIHSVYVDQWDWEKIISKEERTMETLINTVRSIYSVLRKTEKYMAVQYDYIEEILPKEIAFVSTRTGRHVSGSDSKGKRIQDRQRKRRCIPYAGW